MKKCWQPHRNRPISGTLNSTIPCHTMTQYLFKLCSHAQADQAWHYTKRNTNFCTYSRRAYFDLPQTLQGHRGRRAQFKRCESFSIQRIVFPTGTKMPILATDALIKFMPWQPPGKQTTFSHLQPASVVRSSPNFAEMTENVECIKMVSIVLRSNA